MRAINRTLEERFRSLLEADRESGRIALTRVKKINLTHYGRLIGCFYGTLQQFSDLIDEFEGLVRGDQSDIRGLDSREPEFERAERSEAGRRLKSLLDSDSTAGTLVTSRGGRISREHYAKQLGVSGAYMTRFIRLLRSYESKHQIVTGPETRLQEMHDWLSHAFARRELGLRDGKIDRKAFQAHFNLKGGTFLTRSVKIRELFEEFDARVKTEGYQPKADDEDLEKVSAGLQSAPELNRDRLTVNRVALANRLGIARGRLDRDVVDRVIRKFEAELLRRAQESRIDPFVGGRVCPFSELEHRWPRRFLENVGDAFKLYASGLAEPKHNYLQLFDALDWIGGDTADPCVAVIAEANSLGKISDEGAWEDALNAYRDHLVGEIGSGRISKVVANSAIRSLRPTVAALADQRVVPQLSGHLHGVKFARRLTKPLPSLAEVGLSIVARSAVREVIEARLDELSDQLTDDWEAGDLPGFVDALEAETRLVGNLPNDPVEAIKRALERRIEALNSAAQGLIETGMEQYARGRLLVADANVNSREFLTHYFSANLSRTEKFELLRAAFPKASRGGLALSNLLSMIETEFAGIPPKGSNDEYGQFFAKRYLELGGRAIIDPLLLPGIDVIGATLVLYLVGSGANVAVGRTLPRDCIDPTDFDDHVESIGIKDRAGAKPIYSMLPIDSPAIKAIEWLVQASKPLQRAANQGGDHLFLVLIGDRVEAVTDHNFRDWFGRFIQSIEGLAGLALTPRMIRPSVLLRAALENEGRVAVGMAIGQHGAGVTASYQLKWPTRRLYDAQVRKFQGNLETLIIINTAEVAGKMGISAKEMQARLTSLRESGLGTYCKNPLGRPGAEGQLCPTMDCWNDCPQLVLIATVEAIASLQIWQASLRNVQAIWERDHPERWDEVWLPWMCFTDVVEEKMTRQHITIWEAARRHVELVTGAPDFVAPHPW